jgi:hypothetical protein
VTEPLLNMFEHAIPPGCERISDGSPSVLH